jgi:hypothetical protein
MVTPPSSAASPDLRESWRALVDRIKGGESLLGDRLYLLGAGPVPVEGAAGGAMALAADGGLVLVVALAEATPEAAGEMSRQLAAISRLPGSKLREAGVDPAAGGGLAQRHAAFFGLEEPAELNGSQACIVVLGTEPADEGRAALAEALGPGLVGTFLTTPEGVAPLEAPAGAPEAEAEPEPELEVEAEAPAEAGAPAEEAEAEAPAEEAEGPASIEVALDEALPTEAEAETEGAATVAEEPGPELVVPYLEDESTTVIAEEPDEVEKTGVAAWPIGNWIGLTMVVLGVVLAVIGLMNLQAGDTGDTPPAEPPNDLIRTVASDVVVDATHARWIGQQRAVTLGDGTMVFVYPSVDALNLVEDGATAGDTWAEPFAVEEVQPISLSVDVDSKDRLHVAYTDGVSVNYVRLKNKPAGWKPSRLIHLDDTTSPVVDIAWDERNQTAHVVWVQQSDEGEAPAWAALTNEGGIHLSQEGIHATPGTEVPVLVSVAADGRASVLVTYRRGDQTEGWSSRYSPGRDEDGTWAFAEEEAIPLAAFAGAVDVVYDRQKTAHLVLRDSYNFALVYYTKTAEGPWSDGETALTAPDEKGLDLPILSYNAAESNLYLFFQTNEFDPNGEISYLTRSLDAPGWEGPFEIMSRSDTPEGALYPATPDRVEVQAIVFWTKTGTPNEVGAAPVAPPDAAG